MLVRCAAYLTSPFHIVAEADNDRAGVGLKQADEAEELKRMNSITKITRGRFDAMEAPSKKDGGQESPVASGHG